MVAKMHRMPYPHSSFPPKSPVISGSFAKSDLQLKACYEFSAPCMPCMHAREKASVRCIGCLILIGHFLQKSPIISGSLPCVHTRERANVDVCVSFYLWVGG